MQKSQIRGIIGNAMLHLASILILCFFALNMIEGIGRNTIYGAITNLATVTGVNIAYYITASAFHIVVLILSIIMIILSAIGLFGAIFNVKSLNMTIANRVLSIITMISALMALIFMIVYVSLLGISCPVVNKLLNERWAPECHAPRRPSQTLYATLYRSPQLHAL